jgi:hypothetical protein
MFDDLETAENKTEEPQTPEEDEDASSSQLYRWAHFPALLVFAVLIIPLHRHPWGWQIAIAGGYTAYVFWFAFGSVLNSADDFFGDSRVPKYAVELLLPHALILALVVLGVTEWFHLKPLLPEWVTHEGRKGSLWMLFGWLLLASAGIWQGSWMAKKIKRRFKETADSAGEN